MDKELKIQPSSAEKMSHVGTEEHLTTEEILYYLFIHEDNPIDEYFLKETARIHHHNYTCKECKKKYDALLDIKNIGQYYENILSAAKTYWGPGASEETKASEMKYVQSNLDSYYYMDSLEKKAQ